MLTNDVTNDIVSFEEMGPDFFSEVYQVYIT